jgi:hypothetical protein
MMMIDYKAYKAQEKFKLKDMISDVVTITLVIVLFTWFFTSAFSLISKNIYNYSYIEPIHIDNKENKNV